MVTDFLSMESWKLTKYEERTQSALFYNFIGWRTEGDVSESQIKEMLITITLIRKHIGRHNTGFNIVAHDEHSGASAAAVFVALIQLLETIDDSTLPEASCSGVTQKMERINVFGVVSQLRSKRPKMVMRFEEYEFIFRAIIMYSNNKCQYDQILKSDNQSTNIKRQTTGSLVEQQQISSNPFITFDSEGRRYLDGYQIYE